MAKKHVGKRKAKTQQPTQHEITVRDRRAYNKKFARVFDTLDELDKRLNALEQITRGVR